MSRLDAPLEAVKPERSGRIWPHLPTAVRERIAARGLEGSIRFVFDEPAPAGAALSPAATRCRPRWPRHCWKARSTSVSAGHRWDASALGRRRRLQKLTTVAAASLALQADGSRAA